MIPPTVNGQLEHISSISLNRTVTFLGLQTLQGTAAAEAKDLLTDQALLAAMGPEAGSGKVNGRNIVA